MENYLLNENADRYRIPVTGVFKMRGTIKEYRQGHFKVRIYHQGHHYEFYSYNGLPLVHRALCERLLEHLNYQIDSHQFNPSEFQKDSEFRFDNAVKKWVGDTASCPEWVRQKERILQNIFIPYFKSKDIRTIRRNHIEDFVKSLRDKNLQPKTVRNYLGVLRALFRHYDDMIPRIPSFPRISVPEKEIRWLTREQQDQIFQYIPDEDIGVFTFMRFSGTRPNEARALLRENIHWDRREIVINTTLGMKGDLRYRIKNNQIKILPIIEEIEDCLKPRDGIQSLQFVFSKNGQPYGYWYLKDIWSRANLRAHEEHGTPLLNLYNSMKHSFCCQRLNDGFSLDEIGAVTGNKDRACLKRYAKYAPKSLVGVMRGIPKIAQK